MQGASYILLIWALMLFGGLALGSVFLDRERKDEHLVLLPVLGVAGWITGLNFFFFVTKSFGVAVCAMFVIFGALAGRAVWLRLIPSISASALTAIVVAFGFWVLTLIPYVLSGPDDFIGIFLGDAVNYAMEIDFFARHGSSATYAANSPMAVAAELALYERGGFALFAALPAWIAGANGKALVHPVSLLLSPLLFLSAYAALRRIGVGLAATAMGLAAILLNNYYLFNAYGAYSSKALGVPLLLTLLHLLHDALVNKTERRAVSLSAVLSAAVAVTYWETIPIAMLFYMGLLASSSSLARLKPIFMNAVLVLVVTLLLAPNLYGIFTRGVAAKYHSASTRSETGFWDTVRLEPYLLFMTGLHGRIPSIDSAGTRMERVDQWPSFWTKMNRDAASEGWVEKRWKASEDTYLSWRLLLLLSIFFFAGLARYREQDSYFTAIGRFTIVGTFLVLLAGPDKKVFYNFLFYISPYLFIVWAAGLDSVHGLLARLVGRAARVIFALPLFYLYLALTGSVYMIYSAGEDSHSSRLYATRNHIYYKYADSLKELGAFIRENIPRDQVIVFMDDETSAIDGGWNALSYWLVYELRDFDLRTRLEMPHYPANRLSPDSGAGALKGKTLIYHVAHRVLDPQPLKTLGLAYANDNFVVSSSELPRTGFGVEVLPGDLLRGLRRFDGSKGETIRISDEKILSGTKKFTVEFWLRPLEAGLEKGMVSDTYPPMPCLVGPLALYQSEDDSIGVSIKTSDNRTIEYSIDEDIKGRWFHVALEADLEEEWATLYINGKKELEVREKLGPLRGEIYIGQGYPDKKRFWRGDMAGLLISQDIRHGMDFDPAKKSESAEPLYAF
jgi:hypothetical protein